jgi:hypothetical protein
MALFDVILLSYSTQECMYKNISAVKYKHTSWKTGLN